MIELSKRAINHNGDLRRLTTLIGVAVSFFGVLLLAVIAYAGWSANTSAVERERTLVENALNESVTRVLGEQKSIAWWDEAVRHISYGKLDTDWLFEEYGVYLDETYGHDEIYILDASDRPVWAFAESAVAKPATFETVRPQIAPLLDEVRLGRRNYQFQRDDSFSEAQGSYKELLGAKIARYAGHILSINGRPAIVGAMTIVPNLELHLLRGRKPYLLVTVVYMDEAFIGDIGESLLMPDLKLTAQRLLDKGRVAESFSADDGSPAGHLSWTPKRPGQILLTIILPLVSIGLAGAGVLSASMLRRLKRSSDQLQMREATARHQAKHDTLSGLPNRHHFAEQLAGRLADQRSGRSGERLVVAYIDVDRFKDINDTLGHHAGDDLVKAVAQRLSRCLGPRDFIARFGGDEFAVMRPLAARDRAEDLAHALTEAFKPTFPIVNQQVRMTASIGLALAPDHGSTTEALMRHADIALYAAKDQGRDRYMFFSGEMAREVEQRRTIEVDLREALRADQLTLHYQPVVGCANGRINGVEALLRWRHPTKGDVSPALFVPVAENAGLMPELGAWVLDRAMAQAAQWPDIEVSINLSPAQFRHVDLATLLQDLLRKHKVDARRIVLEITEGVMLDATARTRQIFESIRALGFRTALDDFGTGYSSLRYLAEFRFDKIKIDRSFVQGGAREAKPIVQAVVTLGRGLGMDVVAEGVETEAEAALVRHLGCNEMQGFYFSRAIPAADLGAMLAAQTPAAAAEPLVPQKARA